MLKKVEVTQLISDLVHEKVNAIDGKVSPDVLVDETLEEAERRCIGVNLVRWVVESAFEKELNRRIRAIPNPADQLDLFAKQQCEEQFVRYEDGRVSRMGLASIKEINTRREEQIRALRNVNRSFEREERVRERVLPVMEANDMTFGQACRQLKLF